MSTKKPSFLNILSQTSLVITTHFRHFSTLSILFIFPNSLATIVYNFHSQTPLSKSQLPFQIIFFLSSLIFNLCAVSSVTFSAFHAFHGHPLSLIAALKSIPPSFFPLLATTLILHTIHSLIVFGLEILLQNGLQMSLFFVLPVLMYFLVQWSLMQPIVVLESKWGVAPLKRSWVLVKGMRGVIFLMLMLFAALSLLLSGWLTSVASGDGEVVWIGLQVVAYVCISAMYSLYSLVANTVVFVHCKALHEEVASQIDDDQLGLVYAYARLPSDAV